jgi:predicted nucleotidyltransferase
VPPHQIAKFRDGLLDRMVEHARWDAGSLAAALLGSAARQSTDEWSDIDLALRLAPGADIDQSALDWTVWLSSEAEISDYFDIHAWGALYRVFLCGNGLQIDLSFWPWDQFRSINGEPMKVLFGSCLEPKRVQPRSWTEHARMAWLYALHARSAVYRGRALQADLMLTNWRDRIVTLAALRYGLNPSQAREAHCLPDDLQAAIRAVRPNSLGRDDLLQALSHTADLFLAELHNHDPAYAAQIKNAIVSLAAQ